MKDINWIPKQCDLIEVKLKDSNWITWEFIAMTSNGGYLVWGPEKKVAFDYSEARQIKEEPIYYYQYKKLINGVMFITTNYFSHINAEMLAEDDWERIGSTRTTYEELV